MFSPWQGETYRQADWLYKYDKLLEGSGKRREYTGIPRDFGCIPNVCLLWVRGPKACCPRKSLICQSNLMNFCRYINFRFSTHFWISMHSVSMSICGVVRTPLVCRLAFVMVLKVDRMLKTIYSWSKPKTLYRRSDYLWSKVGLLVLFFSISFFFLTWM